MFGPALCSSFLLQHESQPPRLGLLTQRHFGEHLRKRTRMPFFYPEVPRLTFNFLAL